jgi:hypothetical protein
MMTVKVASKLPGATQLMQVPTISIEDAPIQTMFVMDL